MTDTDRDQARIAELEVDNQRLRRLLDRNNAPSELRHRTRSVIAMLRSVIRHSAEHSTNVKSYVSLLEGRLDSVVRAQSAADISGVVPFYMLITEELMRYRLSEEEQFSLSGPEIEFEPKAGQIMSLAIHELAANAIVHGPLGLGGGRLALIWKVSSVHVSPAR